MHFLLFTLEKPKNRMNRCSIGFWLMQGDARKGMKMPSELALFGTNLAADRCDFDQKRENCPVLSGDSPADRTRDA